MATYKSVEDWTAQLEKKTIGAMDKILLIASSTVMAEMTERIFQQGLKADLTKIGHYNTTKPLYANTRRNYPKSLPARGKPYTKTLKNGKTKIVSGATKFKNGNPHKTTWFSSYKELRAREGRESGFVNINLTGTLQRDFSTSLQRFQNYYIAGTKNAADTKKVINLEKKYGKIFYFSVKERALYYATINKEISNKLK